MKNISNVNVDGIVNIDEQREKVEQKSESIS